MRDGRSAPDNGPIGLATDDPTSDAFSLPARRIANEISGGARPDRGKQALRLRAWQAIRRLSTSAIETNYEHDTRSAEPRTRHEEANLDELRFMRVTVPVKARSTELLRVRDTKRRRSGRCRFLRDRSRRKIRPNPDGSSISCRDCATTWVGETRAVRTRSAKPHARKRNHRAKPKLHREGRLSPFLAKGMTMSKPEMLSVAGHSIERVDFSTACQQPVDCSTSAFAPGG